MLLSQQKRNLKMKKTLLALSLSCSFLFGKYNLYVKNVNVGTIEDIYTMQKGYVIAKLNYKGIIATMGKRYAVLYRYSKPNINAKFKYDEAGLIVLGNYLLTHKLVHNTLNVENNRYSIQVRCSERKRDQLKLCQFSITNFDNQKIYNGSIITRNNKLVKICENTEGICIF